MFLFNADEDCYQTDVRAVASGFRVYGPTRELRRNGACLLWIEDRFVRVTQNHRRVLIECQRPQFDTKAICSLEWLFEEEEIILRRRWSGEFGAWHWQEPRIVASHLKLAALAFGVARVPAAVRLAPGHCLRMATRGRSRSRIVRDVSFHAPFRLTRDETVTAVRRLVRLSLASCPQPMAFLLSGGIDSSAIAAAACATRKDVRAFVFSLRRPVRPQPLSERDLPNARCVAAHLGIPLTEILLDGRAIERQVPLAVQLAETARGTIIDECAALISVAKAVRRAGYDAVCMGEAADDLFGGFKFALRLYRGARLRRYYRHELDVSLPDELAVLQNVFRPWGISVIDPYWTSELVRLGYNLPLHLRIDPHRLMKTVLREAFADALPHEIVSRPKCVTRDATQVRDVLEQRFGRSRERYRTFFNFNTSAIVRVR